MRENVSEELEKFIDDLQVFANDWIDEVNNVILAHIDELYNDPAVRHILKLYIEDKKRVKHFNEKYLYNAYVHEDKEVDRYTAFYEWTHQALYEICYVRFLKKEK
jgi:hypothetical protein